MLQYQLQSGGVGAGDLWLSQVLVLKKSHQSDLEALETKTILYYLIPSVLYIKIPLP